EYEVYTASHVVTQLQMVFFAALGFFLANRLGVYPAITDSRTLDFDWFYRKPGKAFLIWLGGLIGVIYDWLLNTAKTVIRWAIDQASASHGEGQAMSRTVSSGVAVSAILAIFGIIVLLAYL
ncbi:MAG: hypothetical protein MI743_03830, partial [Sneathiellales bacterium]|nr:hypothetical protein [Sneathiellales bacterium]